MNTVHRNPYTNYFFIYSKVAGSKSKKLYRHIPGFRTRELAEQRIREWEWKNVGSEIPARDYEVRDEFSAEGRSND